MPGRGSYGPGGKWIHDRAHRIMDKNPDIDKGVAYATATQQAHKVGKSPKKFRTAQGVREAKAKFTMPKKEYQKTAAEGLTREEKIVITNRGKGIGSLAGAGIGGVGGALVGRAIERRGAPIPAKLMLGTLGALGGFQAGESAGRAIGRQRWKKKDAEMKKKAQAAFFDELQKIASRFESEIQRSGGKMTQEAYRVGREDWGKQQALKKKLAPRAAAFHASKGKMAKKPAASLFSRIARRLAA